MPWENMCWTLSCVCGSRRLCGNESSSFSACSSNPAGNAPAMIFGDLTVVCIQTRVCQPDEQIITQNLKSIQSSPSLTWQQDHWDALRRQRFTDGAIDKLPALTYSSVLLLLSGRGLQLEEPLWLHLKDGSTGGGGFRVVAVEAVKPLMYEQWWPFPQCWVLLMCLGGNTFFCFANSGFVWQDLCPRAAQRWRFSTSQHFAETLKGNSVVQKRLMANRRQASLHVRVTPCSGLRCTRQLLMQAQQHVAEWHIRAFLKMSVPVVVAQSDTAGHGSSIRWRESA